LTARVGILGGTYDPVHNAHLAIASAALRALRLEKIFWLPTGAPPYRHAPVAAAVHRLAMLKLAIANEPRYAVDERELAPGASGFTFDSIASLRENYPDKSLILLMGADQYARRDRWHRWQDLAKLCRIAVIERPETEIPKGDIIHIPMTPSAISASELRARIGRGEDCSALLPAAVMTYLERHGLYR